ncbi:MAG: hypothetical protein PW734_02445 [Verrucomicrobium sp.]|nr:hypothetical protein [Verrucomicrobium sp.]
MPDSFETPVAVLIYNRPDKTARILERLSQVQPRRLLVVADGPNPAKPDDAEKTARTRALFDSLPWDCEVQREFSDTNLGCKRRVSSGIDWVFRQVEEAILIEDDILAEPSFFEFCREMLARYRDDERIGTITGCNFQNRRKRGPYSYYFSIFPHIWGWATWRRVWKRYDVDMKLWPEIRASGLLLDLLQDEAATAHWVKEFDRGYEGRIDTWDIQLLLSCWQHSQLTITPEVNLTCNIGFGAEATHTRHAHHIHADIPTRPMEFPLRHPPYMMPDFEAASWTFLPDGWMPEQAILRRERYRTGRSGIAGMMPEREADTPAGLVARAEALLRRQDVSNAFYLLTRASAWGQPVRDLERLRAVCYFSFNRWQPGLESLKAELARFPDNAEAAQMLHAAAGLLTQPPA